MQNPVIYHQLSRPCDAPLMTIIICRIICLVLEAVWSICGPRDVVSVLVILVAGENRNLGVGKDDDAWASDSEALRLHLRPTQGITIRFEYTVGFFFFFRFEGFGLRNTCLLLHFSPHCSSDSLLIIICQCTSRWRSWRAHLTIDLTSMPNPKPYNTLSTLGTSSEFAHLFLHIQPVPIPDKTWQWPKGSNGRRWLLRS
jgi:hypothetical protein